ncbi:MAG: hypothetical protein NT007_15495 [Candidatus Kapabacteria bacterium]|nr:hypothetical protein [Candidatus Kapabacteria bacterium]
MSLKLSNKLNITWHIICILCGIAWLFTQMILPSGLVIFGISGLFGEKSIFLQNKKGNLIAFWFELFGLLIILVYLAFKALIAFEIIK